MLSGNDIIITAASARERGTGSAAGAITAGAEFEIEVAVEAGQTIFDSGARFAAGVLIGNGVAAPAVEGHFGDPPWSTPIDRLTFVVPAEPTRELADRLLSVAAFVRVNIRPPFLVATLRGRDVFVVPAGFGVGA